MDLRQFLGVFRKWWWLMLLSTAIAGFCSWLVVKDQPPIYQTSATLMIGQSYLKPDPNYSDFYTSEQLAQTYSELVRRERLLKLTAAALCKAGDLEYCKDQWASLRGQISANLVAGTQLMEIKVTDTDKDRAKRIADALSSQMIDTLKPTATEDQSFMRTQSGDLRQKIKATQEEIQKLESQLAQTFSARQVQDLQGQINSLRNQVNVWQSTYANYQLLTGAGSASTLTQIEEAPMAMPIGPNWKLQVLLAAAIGFILALAAVLLLEYLDDTIKSPDDVFKMTGLSTLGVITRITGNNPPERLVAARHPKSPISEAYRVMRTNLQFSSLDAPLRTLVVTSANPKEGKSTTLANLGVVMAQAGKSVVLVDSDLRRPALHKIFQVPNKVGLTNLLLEDAPVLNGELQETGIQNLRILTSGPLPPNPSELLGSKRMQRLLGQLTEEADMVLFDTPPALAVTDAAVLASQTDGVLVVTDAGKTRRAAAKHTLENLKQVGANLMGVAMNRLSPRGLGRSYYYYYYYYDSSEGKPRRRTRKKQQ